MILSDHTIRETISNGTIGIDPKPEEVQIQPASLDVRLGREVYHFEGDKSVESPQHSLNPGERYLGHTKEFVDLPNGVAAQLAGRSSVGRKGIIVHKTAGWIDPGFSGQITLELMNLGSEPVHLREGERVAQLVFLELDYPSEGYDGSYQDQEGATHAR